MALWIPKYQKYVHYLKLLFIDYNIRILLFSWPLQSIKKNEHPLENLWCMNFSSNQWRHVQPFTFVIFSVTIWYKINMFFISVCMVLAITDSVCYICTIIMTLCLHSAHIVIVETVKTGMFERQFWSIMCSVFLP